MKWELKKLGELCNIELGKTPARSNKALWDADKNTKNVWLSIADLPKSIKPRLSDSKEYISNKGSEECKLVPKGTLIVSFKLSLGRLAYTACDLYTNEAIAALHINDEEIISQDYLYWFLTFFDWDEAAGNDIKVKGKTLNKAKLKEISVILPPINLQKQIVTLLDKTFSDIGKVQVRAQKNLENAKGIFESYLHQAYTDNQYDEESLGNIVDVLTDYHANGSYKTLKKHVELKEKEDYAWMVRSTDFENQFKNDKRYITKPAYEYLKKTPLLGGEIIMSKIGNAGKVYLMPKVEGPCSLAMNLFLIRLNPKVANNEYVFRYLNSVCGKTQIQPLLNGAATQTITKDSVRSLKIRLPPLEEQERVVNKLNEMQEKVDTLQQIYEQKLIAIDELKRSILKKAFNGELTDSKGAAA
jgi:type I restriction enzyme S subunit